MHLRPDEQVPVSEKLSLLGQVLDPEGPAYALVSPFLTAEDSVENYEKVILALNRRYNYQGSLKTQLFAAVEALKPVTRSRRDQYNFINAMRQLYVDLTHAKVDPEEIAHKIIARVQQVVDDDMIRAFLHDKGIPLAARSTWYQRKKSGGLILEEYFHSIQDILLNTENPDAIMGHYDPVHITQQVVAKNPGRRPTRRNTVYMAANVEPKRRKLDN